MEETGASQLSLTDADARLMKNKNGFVVGYNPQTAVDSETHLIRDFEMTNQVTDHGMLSPTMEGIQEETPEQILEADTSSTKPEELKKSLHSGKIPEAYKDVISKMEVKEVRRKVKEELADIEQSESIYGTPEEMLERAKEGYFVRDPERNLVYCPEGEILRQKCIKKNGNIRYANKNACRHCKNRNKCYKGKGEWKEIDFTKDTLEKPCKEWLKADGKECEKAKQAEKGKQTAKARFEKVKVVKFFLKPSIEKMSQRMCLSEHPFGTIKRAMGATYFLLKGLRKVTGEWGLWTIFFILTAIASVITCLFLGDKLDKQVAYRFVSDSNTFRAFAIGFCSFMFFKDLKIKQSRAINIIGGSTFGVLLIHANSDTMRKWLWGTVLNMKGAYSLPFFN